MYSCGFSKENIHYAVNEKAINSVAEVAFDTGTLMTSAGTDKARAIPYLIERRNFRFPVHDNHVCFNELGLAKDDIFVVYIRSHGRKGGFFIGPHGEKVRVSDFVSELRAACTNICSLVVIFADFCYSGALVAAVREQWQSGDPAVWVVSSSKKGKKSPAAPSSLGRDGASQFNLLLMDKLEGSLETPAQADLVDCSANKHGWDCFMKLRDNDEDISLYKVFRPKGARKDRFRSLWDRPAQALKSLSDVWTAIEEGRCSF